MSRLSKLLAGAAFAATLGFALPASAAVNIVANPGFETGDLTGWTNTTGSWSVDLAPTFTAFDGAHYASTGCTSACDLSQTLATQVGATYTLSFAFNPGEGAGPVGSHTEADTMISWNGTAIFDIAGGAQRWDLITIPDLVATGTSTVLSFDSFQIPAWNGLDDVSVVMTAFGAVPEPATWIMLILGFGMVGGMLRASRDTRRPIAA